MKTFWNVVRRVIVFFVRIFCRALRKEYNEDMADALLQFVKFGIVGLSNTVISYVLYCAALILFQNLGILQSLDYLVAQVIAFLLSVLWSFYWNNKYVFTKKEGEQRNIWAALLKTYVSYAFTGLFLNSILAVLWVEVCGISKFISPIINLLISVPINFFMNKLWAFRVSDGI